MLTHGEIETAEWRWVFIASAVLIILVSVPFIWAYGVGRPSAHFMGVLVSPIDGASYQAKIYEGYEGNWLFHLPYTPEQHRGVFLFTFYLAMGHLARMLGQEPILVFHVVRVVGGLIMFVALYRFVADWTDDVEQRRVTWLLIALGAGFGWVALIFGKATPDLLVLPEAFPLQALYANAHFPWAIAAAVMIAHILARNALDDTAKMPDFDVETVGLAASALLLVSVSPFALLPLGLAYGALTAWFWWHYRAWPARQVAWGSVVLLFGLPLVAYNAWAISGENPVFQAWMAQNLTPSPPVWQYLVAFGPLLLLAGTALWASRRNLYEGDLFLLVWLGSSMLMLYAPLGLQRRFALGLIAPLAVYAGRGLWRVILTQVAGRWRLLGVVVAFSLFIPTTVIAIVFPMIGSLNLVREGGGSYFIQQPELQAMNWLASNGQPHDPLVLASPELSLFLPTRGLRVVYGHPFETLHAPQRRAEVVDFYTGVDCSVIQKEQVDYVIVGPREMSLSGDAAMCQPPGPAVFTSSDGELTVYAVGSR